jgi:hypothetical protein
MAEVGGVMRLGSASTFGGAYGNGGVASSSARSRTYNLLISRPSHLCCVACGTSTDPFLSRSIRLKSVSMNSHFRWIEHMDSTGRYVRKLGDYGSMNVEDLKSWKT